MGLFPNYRVDQFFHEIKSSQSIIFWVYFHLEIPRTSDYEDLFNHICRDQGYYEEPKLLRRTQKQN